MFIAMLNVFQAFDNTYFDNEAKKKLIVAASSKGCNYKVLIKTNDNIEQQNLFSNNIEDDDVFVIETYKDMLNKIIYKKINL